MVPAILAGLGAFILVNALLGAVYGLLCGSSQTMNAFLRFSVLAFPMRVTCWVVAAWAGWSAFAALYP